MWLPIPSSSLVEVMVQHGIPTTDRYNATVLNFASPLVQTYVGHVQERVLDESTTDEQSMRVDATAWLPHDAVITATDRVVCGGLTWRVATVKRLSFGSFRHTEVGLVREVTP